MKYSHQNRFMAAGALQETPTGVISLQTFEQSVATWGRFAARMGRDREERSLTPTPLSNTFCGLSEHRKQKASHRKHKGR